MLLALLAAQLELITAMLSARRWMHESAVMRHASSQPGLANVQVMQFMLNGSADCHVKGSPSPIH